MIFEKKYKIKVNQSTFNDLKVGKKYGQNYSMPINTLKIIYEWMDFQKKKKNHQKKVK